MLRHGGCEPRQKSHGLALATLVGQGSHTGSHGPKERGHRPDHSTWAVLRICGCVLKPPHQLVHDRETGSEMMVAAVAVVAAVVAVAAVAVAGTP